MDAIRGIKILKTDAQRLDEVNANLNMLITVQLATLRSLVRDEKTLESLLKEAAQDQFRLFQPKE